MKPFLIALLIISSIPLAHGQTAEYVYKNAQDSSYNCYLTILPDNAKIKGLIVRDYSSLPNIYSNVSSPYKWRDLALKNGLAILYTTTSKNFPELCYTDASTELLDDLIAKVIQKHDIPKQNIFIGGISSSGTRALRYAQFCEQGKSKHNIKIKGVFSVDSPLDLERFYYSVKNHQKYFTDGMLWEAELMSKEFPDKMGCTPEDNAEAYRNRSVFSYRDSDGGNAKYLLNTPLLLFHEPDIDWWVKERGATYYDFNSFDIAGLYNHLVYIGHKDIQLITTSKRGYDRKGERNCHSWTIVDEGYLIKWILERVN